MRDQLHLRRKQRLTDRLVKVELRDFTHLTKDDSLRAIKKEGLGRLHLENPDGVAFVTAKVLGVFAHGGQRVRCVRLS